jgi:agmatinase
MTNTFTGIRSFMKTNQGQAGDKPISVAGVCYDLGTSNRPGARLGPNAVRDASAMLCDGHNPYTDMLYSEVLEKVCDIGDFNIDKVVPLGILEEEMLNAVNKSKLISIGGDHTITYPLLKAHYERYGQMSLIHFDAHVDVWGEGKTPNHGNFLRLAIEDGLVDPKQVMQIGLRSSSPKKDKDWLTDQGVQQYTALNVHHLTSSICGVRSIVQLASSFTKPMYMTFDIDCLDASQAPGTGTPEIGGLFTWQIMDIMKHFIEFDMKFVGADVVEVAPAYDHAQITALAAATIIWNTIALVR